MFLRLLLIFHKYFNSRSAHLPQVTILGCFKETIKDKSLLIVNVKMDSAYKSCLLHCYKQHSKQFAIMVILNMHKPYMLHHGYNSKKIFALLFRNQQYASVAICLRDLSKFL